MGSLASLDGGPRGNDDASSLAECMHLEASVGAWPRPLLSQNATPTPSYHAVLGAILSDNGEQLWTATETNSNGTIAITGYKRRRRGSHAHWSISHSFASITGIPREAQSHRVHLHVLTATQSIAAVCCTGAVFVVPVEEASATPLRFYLDSYSSNKSATVIRQMRRDGTAEPIDIITHVRFHSTRRCLSLEHYAISAGPQAARGKILIEASLQPVWETCLSRSMGPSHPPSLLLDCAWTVTNLQRGLSEQRSHGPHADSGMLVALDTVFLRISPAPQRRLHEDSAGVHKDRWLTYVLDLPVVAAPLPSLHEHHSFTGCPSGDSIPDFHAPDSPLTQQQYGAAQPLRQSRAESTASSHGTQQPTNVPPQRLLPQSLQQNLAGSMLARFFGSSVSGGVHQGSPAPSTIAAPAPHDSAASSSSKTPPLHSRHGLNGSVNGMAKAPSPARRRLWILPLSSSSSFSEAASTAGVAVQLGHFLVVSPPFVIAVDALGQPDPRHAMLDLAASFRGTHLEGSSLVMLDAAVLADKLVVATQSWLLIYEWVNTASRDGLRRAGVSAIHQLELVQNIMLTPASFASRASVLALVSGPRCQNFAVYGPLRVALYAPQVPAKRALRLVRKGDMPRALQLLQSEVLSSQHRPEAQQWLQRVIGMSIAHCLRQDKWLWALKFFALADLATLHPAQLLAAILPALFAVDARIDRTKAAPTLLAAAKECVHATVLQHCAGQHNSVRSLFEEVMDGPPAPLLMELVSAQADCNQMVWRRRSPSVFSASPGPSPSSNLDHRAGTSPHAEAKDACSAMASVLAKVLEAHATGFAGASPGQERFPRLLKALSTAGELFPDLERGLPGQLGYIRGTSATGVLSKASASVMLPTHAGHSRTISQASFVSLRAATGASASVEGLDYLDWCKTAQIWLLQLAGDRKQLEAVCWQPGLWGDPPGRQLQQSKLGQAVGNYLADVLQESNEARAAGLLLQAIGCPDQAVDIWMGEYDSQCSQIGLRRGVLHPDTAISPTVPLHDCQALEEHVVAAATLARPLTLYGQSSSPVSFATSSMNSDLRQRSAPGDQRHHSTADNRGLSMSAQQLCAASRALLIAATAAECMCDCVAIVNFTDGLISWLLRMPNQCALAVLLSRTDISIDDVFSPNHAVRCSISNSTAARRSAMGTEPSGASQNQDSDPESLPGSDVEEAFADQDDPGQLWLQVRYLSAALTRTAAGHGEHYRNGNVEGLPDASKHLKTWMLYLTQLLRLALVAAEGQWEDPPQAVCTHTRYGPQVIVRGFAIAEEWMAPEFINALWHPGASACMAEFLLPLRPLLISPVLPGQLGHVVSVDSPDGRESCESLENGRYMGDAAPYLHPGTSPALTPDAEVSSVDVERDCSASSVRAVAPISSLFEQALQQAPEAAVTSIKHLFEELYPDPCHCTSRVKQLYVAVLERQATLNSVLQAVGVLAGCPSTGDTMSFSSSSLKDLTAALNFVTKYTTDHRSEHFIKHSGDLCAALWGEVLHCSMGPQTVLVQYVKSQLMSQGLLIQDGPCVPHLEQTEQLMNIMDDDAPGPDGSGVLLKDAAPAISSLIKTVQGLCNTLSLQRSMHQQCKITSARALVAVEDSYIKWNEGPTSMDVMTDPESIVLHMSDPPENKRSLPPPRKGGSPWCGVCKRDMPMLSGRRGERRLISWPTASFVCQDPTCKAAASATSSAGLQRVQPETQLAALILPDSAITTLTHFPRPEAPPAALVSTTLKLRLSLVADMQGPADASIEETLAAAARFGHFWSLSDGHNVYLRRHEGVGGGRAETHVPTPTGSTSVQLTRAPGALTGESLALAAVQSRSFAFRAQVGAQILPNPDNPAVAIITSNLAARDTYDSFSSISAGLRGPPQVSVPTSPQATAHTMACIVRAVERPDAPMQLLAQQVIFPGICDSLQKPLLVSCCAWAGGGTQALLGASCGHVLCVDADAIESSEQGAGAGSDAVSSLPSVSPREVAAVPTELGSVIGLVVVRLHEGEAVLISTSKCLLALSGQGAVGALRRYGAAPGKWSMAVAVEAVGGSEAREFHTQLAMTQAPVVGVAHVAWICRSILHTFDVGAPSVVGDSAEYAQGAQLLHQGTYSRIQLSDVLARSLINVAVLPRYVLILAAGASSDAPLLHAIWRASGQAAYTIRIYEGIGRPVGLVLDPEDLEIALDAVMAVYVVGTHGKAVVDVEEPAWAGAWDCIVAGRFTAAEAQVDTVSACPMGSGPVAESVMWASLGRALLERGHRVQAARVLGKVLPGVVSVDTGNAVDTFQQTVLQFCGPGSNRKELRAYLQSKLETLTRNFQSDVSVCGVAAWLLELDLHDLHLAQLRAAAAPDEAAEEPNIVQANISKFLLKHRDVLESRVVLEMLAQQTAPSLLLYALELYGMHAQAFDVAVTERVPKAMHLLETIHRTRPELLTGLVSKLMWHHPIATCTALAAGRSTIPPLPVVSCAHRYAKPSNAPFILRVQDALRQYLEGHIAAGNRDTELHALYVRLLALGGHEATLLEYIDTAAPADTVEDSSAQASGLCFDAQEALVLAKRCGLRSAARRLLLLRGDFSAAIALAEDVDTAAVCLSKAASASHRDLWLQFAQRRAADQAAVTELHHVVEASGGCVSPEDLLPLIPRGGPETVQQIEELVDKHLESESAKLKLLEKQFEGLGDCMMARHNALQDLQKHVKDLGKPVPSATVCAACGSPMSRTPKSVRSLGDGIPPAVVYMGGKYHVGCAVQFHLRFMSHDERKRWPWLLDAFSTTSGDTDVELSRRQAISDEYLLEQLQEFFRHKGDPLLSPGLISSVSETYGECEGCHEDQLLQLPSAQN